MSVNEIQEMLARLQPNSKVPLPNDSLYGYCLIRRESLVHKGQLAYFIVAPPGRDGQWRLEPYTLRRALEGELHIHD